MTAATASVARERSTLRLRSWGVGALIGLGVLLALIALLLIDGKNPLQVGAALFSGAFGTARSTGESLIRAAPLLIIAVSLAPSLRARIFNLGAPGQIGLGALAATVVALALADAPMWLALPLGALAGAAGGIVAAIVPGLLRSRYGINEIITTIAVNFIVGFLLLYLLNGPMLAAGANSPQSEALGADSWLPVLIAGTRTHWGIVVALLAVVALMLFDRTKQGYRMRLFASNQNLAKQIGVKPRQTVFALFIVAGAGAGLAGWMQLAGVDHRLYTSVADPMGFSGLVVALLAASHPIGMLLGALLLGGLLQGGQSLQVGVGLPPEIVQVLVGLVVLAYSMIMGRKGLRD